MFEEKEYLEKPKYIFEFPHFIFALLFFVLGSVYYNLVFVHYSDLNVTIFTFLFFALGASYFFVRKIRLGKTSLFIIISSLVFSLAALTKTMDEYISLLWFLVLHLSALLFTLSVYLKSFSEDFLYALPKSIIAPFKSIFSLPLALFAPLKHIKEKSEKKSENLTLIIIGILVSIPIIIVVCSLLLSDAFFHNFAYSGYTAFIDFISHFNPFRYINFLTLFVSFYLFGAFYNAERDRDLSSQSFISVPSIISATVIIALLAFYVIFFISQLVGVIQCIFASLPEGETYSSFARSGFFNICIVSCINGLILYFTNKKTDNKLINTLSVILSLSTLLIISIAFSKMVLYICAFGFTPKRFYTIWFMLLLFITFTLTIVKFRKKSFPLSETMIYVTYSMLLVLFFINFESLSVYLNK